VDLTEIKYLRFLLLKQLDDFIYIFNWKKEPPKPTTLFSVSFLEML